MIAKELETVGIPVAHISTLDVLTRSVGANRIIRGRAIINVVGDPSLRPDEEQRFRKELVSKALRALGTPVQEPTVLG